MSNIPDILGDKSPESKRQIARPKADNYSLRKTAARKGAQLAQGGRLVDIVHTLAANLNRIMGDLKAKKDPRGSNQGLASAIGQGFSSNTIGRARRGDGSCNLRSLTKIARALGVSPLQLIAPDLNLADPPEVVSDPHEKHLLRAFRQRRSDPQPPTTH